MAMEGDLAMPADTERVDERKAVDFAIETLDIHLQLSPFQVKQIRSALSFAFREGERAERNRAQLLRIQKLAGANMAGKVGPAVKGRK